MTLAESKCFSTILHTSLLLCSPIVTLVFFHYQVAVFIAKVAAVSNTHRLFLFPPFFLLNKTNVKSLTPEFLVLCVFAQNLGLFHTSLVQYV